MMPKSQRRKSADINSLVGRISIGVASKGDDQNRRSQGIRNALHILSVWNADKIFNLENVK
jgi:hypothetical protein